MPARPSTPQTGGRRGGRDASPPRGRPRDATRDAAIHAATLELLAADGYDRLTVGAIATRAGVGKATIYRRWPDKAAVVASAVEQLGGDEPPEPSGSELGEDLRQVVTWLAAQIGGQDAGIVAAVIAGMRSDPELAAAMRDRLRRDEATMIDHTLRRAAARGEPLVADADALFAEVAPAVITHRLLIAGRPCDRRFVEHLVDRVLLPLLLLPGSGRP